MVSPAAMPALAAVCALGNVVDDGGAVEVLVDFVVVVGDEEEQKKARRKLEKGPARAIRTRCQRGLEVRSSGDGRGSPPVGEPSPPSSPAILT